MVITYGWGKLKEKGLRKQNFERVKVWVTGVTGKCPGVRRRGPAAKMTIKFLLVHWANWPEPQ